MVKPVLGRWDATIALFYLKILFSITKTIFQMINLLSNDVNRLDYSVFSIHYIWIAPIQTVIISYLLYREMDLAAIGGISTLVLFIPIHGELFIGYLKEKNYKFFSIKGIYF